jgi:hypothetical protein
VEASGTYLIFRPDTPDSVLHNNFIFTSLTVHNKTDTMKL